VNAGPGRGESSTLVMLFFNFSVHSCNCVRLIHLSLYWILIQRWISVVFTPSLNKNLMTLRCSCLVHCCKDTTILSNCFPGSYACQCRLLVTLGYHLHAPYTQWHRSYMWFVIQLFRFSTEWPLCIYIYMYVYIYITHTHTYICKMCESLSKMAVVINMLQPFIFRPPVFWKPAISSSVLGTSSQPFCADYKPGSYSVWCWY
jgi:hypothetical protein